MARKYFFGFDHLEGRTLLSGPPGSLTTVLSGDGGTGVAIPIGSVTTTPISGSTGETVGVIYNVGPITTTPLPILLPTVTTDKVAYRIGQRVRITVAFRNGGAIEAALPSGNVREHITIIQGSTVVWNATRPVPLGHLKTIQPGQTITFSKVWDGRPNQAGVHHLKAGTYSVTVDFGGNDSSGGTIQLIPRKS